MSPLTWALKEVDPVGLHRQPGIHAQENRSDMYTASAKHFWCWWHNIRYLRFVLSTLGRYLCWCTSSPRWSKVHLSQPFVTLTYFDSFYQYISTLCIINTGSISNSFELLLWLMELLVLTAIISRFKDIFIGWYSIKGSDIRSFKTK
jgi:hypothetical protein